MQNGSETGQGGRSEKNDLLHDRAGQDRTFYKTK
jgi:hypothetical protein